MKNLKESVLNMALTLKQTTKLKTECQVNCKKLIDKLVKDNYHGQLNLDFRDGHIVIGEKRDKIRFEDEYVNTI